VTVAGETGRVSQPAKHDAPLASYVLRVTGRPATLCYELHDVRSGVRVRFSRADALVSFLRRQGLEVDGFEVAPGDTDTDA
jgi:hypothetical protein